MSQLQKKCFLASAGAHLLLFLVLLVGPAFMMSKNKLDDLPTLDFIPAKLIDEQFYGGGNPHAQPPPAQPVRPQPPQREVRVPDPEPQPARPTEPEKTQPAQEEPKWTPNRNIKINTHRTIRKTTTSKPRVSHTPSQPSAAKAFESAAAQIRARTASTSIEVPQIGPGSGEAYANYAQVVKSIYERAWVPPDDTSSDDANVKVRVTIAKSGKVTASRILSRSGDSAVDGSIEATLRRVTFIRPFPKGAKEDERSYTINFNLKARRLAG